jgi:hypothetical protein
MRDRGTAHRFQYGIAPGDPADIDKKLNRWHLQIADRWIVQYNFLYLRPVLGPDVRAHVPLPSVLCSGLS